MRHLLQAYNALQCRLFISGSNTAPNGWAFVIVTTPRGVKGAFADSLRLLHALVSRFFNCFTSSRLGRNISLYVICEIGYRDSHFFVLRLTVPTTPLEHSQLTARGRQGERPRP